MLLNNSDQIKIMRRFPKFELSYEKYIHKKVYTKDDVFVSVPFGVKYYAWFTYFNNDNVCFICELNNDRKIKSLVARTCCFSDTLSHGTIVYGTIVNNRFFVIENIYYMEGNPVINKKYIDKLEMINELFISKIKQVSFVNNDIIFTTPIINSNCNELIKQIETLPYKIYAIKFINLYNNRYPHNIFIHKLDKKDYFANFKIKPTIKNDIYETYYYDRGEFKKHNVAYIPSYVCSVMMNRLFRTIKENERLDSLEESDDEDEFENVNDDKFVDLNKSYIMKCKFHLKFHKWVPIEVVKHSEKLVTYNDLWAIENKFIKSNRRTEFPRKHHNYKRAY